MVKVVIQITSYLPLKYRVCLDEGFCYFGMKYKEKNYFSFQN